jgi:flagellar hook protein FlgE
MSFQQGLSGLNASSRALDAIGNNIANSGTVGFKGANAQFSDIYAASLNGTGSSQVGIGTNVAAVAQTFTQGNLTTTNNPLDLAINGGGFYRMSDQTGASAGSIAYTRNGQFLLNKDGYVVNSQGLYLTGLQADPITGIVPNSGQPGAIRMDTSLINPNATTESEVGFNLDSREAVPTNAFDQTDPTTYNWTTTQPVYDSLGNPHNLQLYFVKMAPTAGPPVVGANTWQMYTSLDGSTAAVTGPNVTFDAFGNMTAPAAPVALSFALTNGAATPFNFTLDITDATQFGDEAGLNSMVQDGYTSGRLSGVAVSADGTIQGVYSNGRTRDMGRIVLSSFQNPNGLQNMGGNLWRETADSGQPVTGMPGEGNFGVIQSASVEDSNVDLTAELVDMIVQQRAYQANAQTIKTQDQILQTLVNLR